MIAANERLVSLARQTDMLPFVKVPGQLYVLVVIVEVVVNEE